MDTVFVVLFLFTSMKCGVSCAEKNVPVLSDLMDYPETNEGSSILTIHHFSVSIGQINQMIIILFSFILYIIYVVFLLFTGIRAKMIFLLEKNYLQTILKVQRPSSNKYISYFLHNI